MKPFVIEPDDVIEEEEEPKRKRVVVTKRRTPRFQALNDDMIWIAEQDIARMKRTMAEHDRPMTDKEHARFIKTAEQLRKLRWTDAELNKLHDPARMDDELLDEEFDERCRALGLDPRAVEQLI